jgi:cysteine desulfurase
MSYPIYMDYAATTPVDRRVAKSMMKFLDPDGVFGNPASRTHVYGWQAEEAVENARMQVAGVINADPREIVWTSGATESDNLAIKGLAHKAKKKHIITSKIEHKAVLDTCHFLEEDGFDVTFLEPDLRGCCSGSINDVAAIAKICQDNNVFFHVDAAQGFGKLKVDVRATGIDLLSVSGHKIYGPKGIGVIFVNRESDFSLNPLIHGGGHEFGMRSGTLATHQIVGLGEASELIRIEGAGEAKNYDKFRDILLSNLNQIPDVHINSDPSSCIPSIVNVSFGGVDGETLMNALDNVALSSGSACNSELIEPSYVLKGIGLVDKLANSALRFSFGRYTEESEVQAVSSQVARVVGALRNA